MHMSDNQGALRRFNWANQKPAAPELDPTSPNGEPVAQDTAAANDIAEIRGADQGGVSTAAHFPNGITLVEGIDGSTLHGGGDHA